MTNATPSAEQTRQTVARILASDGFSRSDRLRRFLRFLVDECLAGRSSEIKESVIGIEVFGRPAGYDPRKDPVVRIEAGKLRSRLLEYYAGPGASDDLRIELPKGTYVPIFRRMTTRHLQRFSAAGASAMLLCTIALWAAGFRNPPALPPRGGAYDLFRKGQYYAQRVRPGEIQTARSYFEQAIQKDPTFAPAYAALADTYLVVNTDPQSRRLNPKARNLSLQALELNPKLGAAHAVMGQVYARERNWRESERSFQQALKLDPNNSDAHRNYAVKFLFPVGRIEDSLKEVRRALELDPLSLAARSDLAGSCLFAGRYQEAIERGKAVLAIDPNYPRCRMYLGRAYLAVGKVQEAIEVLRLHETGRTSWLAYAYAVAGRREEALAILQTTPMRSHWTRAVVWVGLGENDRALEELARSVDEVDPNSSQVWFFPEFAELRNDPRFAALQVRQGLPVYDVLYPVHAFVRK
jgi:tetratricopeptide (TPR) repeat protein